MRSVDNVMNYVPFHSLSMVLETPIDRENEKGKLVEDHSVWANEIKMLEGLIGMNVEGEEFKTMERKLWEQGKEERKKFQAQVDKKANKRSLTSWLKGAKKKQKEDDGGGKSDRM